MSSFNLLFKSINYGGEGVEYENEEKWKFNLDYNRNEQHTHTHDDGLSSDITSLDELEGTSVCHSVRV